MPALLTLLSNTYMCTLQNGLLSAIPYIILVIINTIAAYIADKLGKNGVLSITAVRKIFNTFGSYVSE